VAKTIIARDVSHRAVEVTSFGTRAPAVPTPPGVAEPRNRRVDITVR
jgi:OmpA-OmpF porin, OOP family